MKRVKKVFTFIFVLASLALAGCMSFVTPVDLIWPVPVNEVLEVYLDKEAPSIEVPWLGNWRFTSLALAKIQRKEAEFYHFQKEIFYTTGMDLSRQIVKPAEEAKDQTMQVLMALGAGSPAIGAIAFMFGKKKDTAETQRKIDEAGRMSPAKYEKTKV